MAFKIDLGVVATNVLSVSIISVMAVVASQVYKGSTETATRTAASVEVIIAELAMLRETVETINSQKHDSVQDRESDHAASKSATKRVMEVLTLAPLWKTTDASVEDNAIIPQSKTRVPEAVVPAAELERELWQQIDDKSQREKQ